MGIPTKVSKGISIHALREEGDLIMLCSSVSAILFLSTPSARRATRLFDGLSEPFYISIHALREEGDTTTSINLSETLISIHALREEGDMIRAEQIWDELPFLSTPSARRATDTRDDTRKNLQDFYPRPPRGGRLLETQQ